MVATRVPFKNPTISISQLGTAAAAAGFISMFYGTKDGYLPFMGAMQFALDIAICSMCFALYAYSKSQGYLLSTRTFLTLGLAYALCAVFTGIYQYHARLGLDFPTEAVLLWIGFVAGLLLAWGYFLLRVTREQNERLSLYRWFTSFFRIFAIAMGVLLVLIPHYNDFLGWDVDRKTKLVYSFSGLLEAFTLAVLLCCAKLLGSRPYILMLLFSIGALVIADTVFCNAEYAGYLDELPIFYEYLWLALQALTGTILALKGKDLSVYLERAIGFDRPNDSVRQSMNLLLFGLILGLVAYYAALNQSLATPFRPVLFIIFLLFYGFGSFTLMPSVQRSIIRTTAAGTSPQLHLQPFVESVKDKSGNLRLVWARAIVNVPVRHERGRRERPRAFLGAGPESEQEHFFVDEKDEVNPEEYIATLEGGLNGNPTLNVLISGYNVGLDDAIVGACQTGLDADLDPLLLYWWGSAGLMLGYLRDEDRNDIEIRNFNTFLTALTSDVKDLEINILAHSMGSRLLVDLIDQYGLPISIKRVILIAPDVSEDKFRLVMGESTVRLPHAPDVTLFTSTRDLALEISGLLHCNRRIGMGLERAVEYHGKLEVIDISGHRANWLAHSTVFENPMLLDELGNRCRGADPGHA